MIKELRVSLLALTLLLLLGFPHGSSGIRLRSIYNKRDQRPSPQAISAIHGGIGRPLHLSDHIEHGSLDEARRAAHVDLDSLLLHSKHAAGATGDYGRRSDPPRASYSGFITVNKTCDSNLFFWFIPAKNQPESAPVTVWLQGGPGGSSMFGLFVEHGPWIVEESMNLRLRDYDWSATHSMLYIDQPVGTGFSYTGKEECYAKDQNDVARDLYSFLVQFFTLFPDFQPRDFYVTGESYAGKYVPAITRKIIQENPNAQVKINLKGMGIGDGLCDPISMTNYGDYLYQVGMIGYRERKHFREVEEDARKNIQQGNWKIASELFDQLLDGDMTGTSYFKNVTGSEYYFNFLQYQEPKDFSFYEKFLNLPNIRRAIHVGDKVFHNGSQVEKYLFDDIMKSVKPWVEDILNAGYKVLLFNGQLDIIVGYPLTESFVHTLNWQHSAQFKDSPRLQWKIGSVTAGYVQEYQNLAVVMVRNAGHMVPYDQPVLGFDLINRFTSGKPFATNFVY